MKRGARRAGLVAISLFLLAFDGLGESNTLYRVLRCDPPDVEVHWLNDAGKPYRTFGALEATLRTRGRRAAFIMNAGIFEPGGIPTGLLVVRGRELVALNTAAGKGNFYLQPNGVFWIDHRGAHIDSTADYRALQPHPSYAVQSGPLLLNKGLAHPAFRKESVNRLHRNGVGIATNGQVIFAISELPQEKLPNLYEFADFFRKLGCRDALFLDGDISAMYLAAQDTGLCANAFGALITVTKPIR